jgi:hypothetical protein
MTSRQGSSFLYDLGVLDHGDAAAIGHFAFQGDRFAAVLSQLIVHRFVFADDQIRFAVAHDPDRTAALDTLGSAALAVLLADSIMIDVAHHIDDFTGHFFRSGRIITVLLCDGQWCDRERTDERRSNCDLHYCRFTVD